MISNEGKKKKKKQRINNDASFLDYIKLYIKVTFGPELPGPLSFPPN